MGKTVGAAGRSEAHFLAQHVEQPMIHRHVPSIATLVIASALGAILLRAAADEPLKIDAPWRYVLEAPAGNWQAPEFDDRTWNQGPGGFGAVGTPGARVGTPWNASDIWMRRTFALKSRPKRAALYVHHDEDAEIFVNGSLVAELPGYTTQYEVLPLPDLSVSELRAGANVLAVHCHQTGGGQYIDVHVIDPDHIPPLPAQAPYHSTLLTTAGQRVLEGEAPWSEYPRPHLVRSQWTNLNGHWDYAVTSLEAGTPTEWEGKILVPFCLESKLSGVQRLLQPTEALWYQRTIDLQPRPDRRTLLNFEAVDYRCQVWVNQRPVGEHVGGNLPFTLDITDKVKDGSNAILVRVVDSTGGAQLRGKQTLDPQGIWYTRVSGIWQTVWLEETPKRYIQSLQIRSDVDRGAITITPQLAGQPAPGERLRASVLPDGNVQAEAEAETTLLLHLDSPQPWSPVHPQLYPLRVTLLGGDGQPIDEVQSYTALRKIAKVQDDKGHWRLALNGQTTFMLGPLDQGWWPDGLLTPPSDAAIIHELEFLKQSGFNMLRKHIKVEPRRYYYHCDRLGLMVWQDQVSGGVNPPWTRLAPGPRDAAWSDEDHRQYLAELQAMLAALDPFACIVMWVPFNEAWGQHRSSEVGRWTAAQDPSRLVNIASGGNFWPVGDVADEHRYPQPGFPLADPRFNDYVKVVGEFGGHGWPVENHLWNPQNRNWGYGDLPKSLDEYQQRYRQSMKLLAELKSQGVAAGVYTQTTDVEGEINGLLTYDRKVAKIPAEVLREIHRPLLARSASE